MKEQQNNQKFRFGMFLVTIGIVYGDIGTSPMYVMKSILEGNGGIRSVDESFGDLDDHTSYHHKICAYRHAGG